MISILSTAKRPILDSIKSTLSICAVNKRNASHTDIVFPNFDDYRLESVKNPTGPEASESVDDRRGTPSAIVYGVGGACSVISAKVILNTLVEYKSMPADMKAMASVEINLDEVPEGKTKTFEWRGKPIFVKHRTEAEIKREQAVEVSQLRDPQKDEDRVQRPEWSILIGVCTHLGCIPISNMGEFGGYFCPCHGSHYDASGRIRKGPAPLNMEIPDYEFVNDNTIVFEYGKEKTPD
uniref:Cytochrome b-c1 complex subunit Rieske, mitochondrial n=1 Tax=Meloidogyne javanica TaxID=6303 RepID=A0A915MDQ8_MELJA